MNVLLSISPCYANAILDGSKRYELRRRVFRDPAVDCVFLYSTVPEKKVVGLFQVREIVVASPRDLWEVVQDASGIDRQLFFRYFHLANTGYAIGVAAPVRLDSPIDPRAIHSGFRPPQSFAYVKNTTRLGQALTAIAHEHLAGHSSRELG